MIYGVYMLRTQHRANYLKKGISSEVIDRLEEQHNAQQSSKSLQFKNRIRRYDPNDTNISKLFLMMREQKIGDPKLDKTNEIEELLAQVENINDIDLNDGGNTLLHVAVSKKHQNIVGLLFNVPNIDPNIKNNQGDTPLHIAASENNKELVSLLLDKKARGDIKNNEGKAPYELTKNPEIINIFQIIYSDRHVCHAAHCFILFLYLFQTSSASNFFSLQKCNSP